jgi:hypothetical protein
MIKFIGGLDVVSVLALELGYVICLANGEAYMIGYHEEIDLIKQG